MTNKNQAIEVPVNSALQANITPIGIDFEMNRLRLGENYCCIFAITDYPSECDYGWDSRLTNIPGKNNVQNGPERRGHGQIQHDNNGSFP